MRKSALITGCTTGGAGNALAKEYQSRGLLVFATARRLESMKDLQDLPGVVLLKLDVLDDNSIQEVFRQVEAYLEEEHANNPSEENQPFKSLGLDILINNAGVGSILPFADTPVELSERIIQTNLVGPMRMTKQFLPLLLRSGDARVVCTGSIAGLAPTVHSVYNASKTALRSWCDTIRMELAPFNIHVIHLVMGLIHTNMVVTVTVPLPADSLYLPIEDSFVNRRQRAQATAITGSQFARRAADVSLRRKPPREAFIGAGSTSNLWLTRLFSRAFIDWMIAYATGLLALAVLVKSGDTTTRIKGQGWIDVLVRWIFA